MSAPAPNRYWMSEAANAVADRYEALVGEDAFDYGPGHIVFADPNLEDHSLDYCIAECDDPNSVWKETGQVTDEDVRVVRACLVELRAMPEAERWGEGYPEALEREWPSSEGRRQV